MLATHQTFQTHLAVVEDVIYKNRDEVTKV